MNIADRTRSKIMEKGNSLLKPNITVKDFTGSGDIDDWLEDFDLASKIYGWDDTSKCLFAPFFLKGTARMWYRKNKDSIKDWSSFRKGLTMFFLLFQQARLCQEKLRTRNQGKDESVKHYADEIMNLCLRMNSKMDDLKMGKYFLDGLRKDLKSKIISWDQPFTSLKLQAEMIELSSQEEVDKVNIIHSKKDIDHNLNKKVNYLKKEVKCL